MHSLDQLLFAQHFPFSGQARHIVKEQNLSLEALPDAVVERAELMARQALQGKKDETYTFELRQSELLLQEILAFPVAKILVSFSGSPSLYQKFSGMVADSGYDFLAREKDIGKTAVRLASDLGIKLDFPQGQDFFVSLALNEFLPIPFRDDSLKLVNQFVSRGKVFLDLNGLTRFLREKSFALVRGSLPVPVDGLPKRLESIARNLKSEGRAREKKFFENAFSGNLVPEAFPPCIAQMYSQLASGQKLPHMANFTLAAFLNSVGMPKAQILALFRKSPNFKERIASYQIDRIARQKYTPPSCEKIRGYGVCPNAGCGVSHPLSFYRRNIGRGKGKAPASVREKPAGEKGAAGK